MKGGIHTTYPHCHILTKSNKCSIILTRRQVRNIHGESDVMEEQKRELHEIIESINNPKLINYIFHLIKNFIELRS